MYQEIEFEYESESDPFEAFDVKESMKCSTVHSWENQDEEIAKPFQICASECTKFPFAPEISTESILPFDKTTARTIRHESDLVMDFAFLLCGWESRSIKLENGEFSLRYNISLPGVSHVIIEQICRSLSEIARNILVLEEQCGVDHGVKKGTIHTAFCRSVMETVSLHRTLVLKLGTVKSLSLFVKLTRRCCAGIQFTYKIFQGIDFSKADVHLILTLLAFSPYAHGEFEKKLLTFLLKACTKPYVTFIKNLMGGVLVENHIEDFCGNELIVEPNFNAATGGISDILLELHNAVLQCIRNGKILHSKVMKDAIQENIRRHELLNKLEKRIVKVKTSEEEPKETKKKVYTTHEIPPALYPEKNFELKAQNSEELSATLGIELEEFYKELQGRIKSQYDLEDWKQRRSKMALKRRGFKEDPESIPEEESNDLPVEKAESEEAPDDEPNEKNEEDPETEEVKKIEFAANQSDEEVEENVFDKAFESENEKVKESPPKASAKKKLTFSAETVQAKTEKLEPLSLEDEELPEKPAESYGIFGTPKDPESNFLLMVLPLKKDLQALNATSLKVILSGMRFFDHMSMIKKFLFFQNRAILEQICNVVNEPSSAGWRISTVIDGLSRDTTIDAQMLKNVYFKPYQGVNINLSLSYATEWPMTLTIAETTIANMEKASAFFLEFELVKSKLNNLFKDLLTSKRDYPVKVNFMIHEYVLFASRLASYAYSQVHDECWPVYMKRMDCAIKNGKTMDDCHALTSRLFKNISTRLFLEKKASKIHETIVAILKNTSEYVALIQSLNETDHMTILGRAFKKFKDFKTLKEFLLKVLRAINPNGCQYFDDVIS